MNAQPAWTTPGVFSSRASQGEIVGRLLLATYADDATFGRATARYLVFKHLCARGFEHVG